MNNRYSRMIFLIVNFISIIMFVNEVEVKASINDNYLNFNNITTNDGLSQGSIDDIFQDSEGYMWFATNDGLNRYDGNEFKVLKGDNNDIATIWPGLVSDIEEDKMGYLWVGTSGGLARVDKKTLKAKRFITNKNDEKGISHSNIWDVFKDSKGDMWVATEDGINKFDYSTEKFTKYTVDNKSLDNHKKIKASCIEEDSDGVIIIGTKNGLRAVNQKIGKLEFYMGDGIDLVNGKSIIDTFKDSKENIWISAKTGELYKITKNTKKIEFKFNIAEDLNDENTYVKVINEDLEGNMWLGSNRGLYKYNTIKNKGIWYQSKEYDIKTLVDNSILDIYKDKSGLIWIGTLNGISRVNPEQNFINYKKRFGEQNSLSGDSISGIYEDEYGDLWIGTYTSGLNKLDRENDIYTHYKHKKENDNTIASDSIWQVRGDGKGNIWVATRNGLSKINIKTNAVKNYLHNKEDENSIIDNDVREILIDDKGLIWIGTRNGIDIFNPETEVFTNLNEILINNGLDEVYVRRIFQASDGNYYLAVGWSSGLVKLDVNKKEVKVYNHTLEEGSRLSDDVIMGINEGLDGDIWIGTTNGLNRLNPKTGKIKQYKEKQGLANSYVYGVLVDSVGDIWMSTNGGISKYDIKDNYFENYTYADGLQSNEFNAISDFKSKSGEMFFGGVNGVSSFNPKEISKKEVVLTPVVISDFNAYNNKEYLNDVELKHSENNFRVSFILPDYRDPESIKYEYKLDGFDDKWVCAGKRREVMYTNISPGNYTFKVRAVLKGGEKSSETIIEVKIKTPWYFSHVAISIYIMIIIGIIIISINYVKILDGLIKQRTFQLDAEILAKDKLYEEKEALYEEVIRYEKFRNTYLVNLSHELRTPLNVILSSQQLISALNKLEEGIERCKLEKYMKIIKSNSENLLEVINDLIDSSKVKSGAYNIKLKENDIVYIVEEVALSMKSFIENEGLELIIDPDIEEKLIMCSKTEIERCVRNLISNSVKFTESGGTIFIGVRETDNFVEIIVKDSGKGISKEDQSIIFDRFTQIEDGVSSKHFSSGIGLNLVKDLTELHKGTISIISELGKGSEFIIKLPTNM